jgi:hypothetical protein
MSVRHPASTLRRVPESIGQFRRRTCGCGLPPDQCIPDETVLVQYTFNSAEFRNKPRMDRETSMSMLLAEGWTLAQVSEYVRRSPPTAAILERSGMRETSAGAFRKKGFAVVHTPGRMLPPVHVSIVWPDEDPLNKHIAAWPEPVSDDFDSCFNGEEEQ